MLKTFTIIRTRKGKTIEMTGTLTELIERNSYTLEVGNSYDPKVNTAPKTAKGLVAALNRATDSLQQGSYDPNFYQLKESK